MPRILVWPNTVKLLPILVTPAPGDELQPAAIDRQRGQRGDQRVDPEAGDEHAVDDAEQHAPAATDQERGDRRKPQYLAARPGHDAGKGEDAADRKIEHAADHQHHHPAGEDAGLRRVEQHDRGVRRAHEGGRLEDRHHRDERDDQHDEQLPLGGDQHQKRGRHVTFRACLFHTHAASCLLRDLGRRSGCEFEDGDFARRRGIEFTRYASVRHHDDAVGERQHFGEVRGHRIIVMADGCVAGELDAGSASEIAILELAAAPPPKDTQKQDAA